MHQLFRRRAALLTALAALSAAAPALAQSAPATDDFEVTATILPPTPHEVQVLGMDDIDFGQIELGAGQTVVPALQDYFCLNRTSPGNVFVRFDQPNDADTGPGFRMAKGGADYLPFRIVMTDPAGIDWPIERGVQFPTPRSAEDCEAGTASNANTGHRIDVKPEPVPSGTPSGLYRTTIQITILPAG